MSSDSDDLYRDLLRVGGGDYAPVAERMERFRAYVDSVVASRTANGAMKNGAPTRRGTEPS